MREETDKSSESYARRAEIKQALYYRKYADLEKIYLKQIDDILLSGEKADRIKLSELKEKIEKYKYTSNRMIDIITIMNIYWMEAEAGEEYTILDMNSSGKPLDTEALGERVRELRFLLWRIEFLDEESAKERLLAYIAENHVSPYFLSRIVSTITGDKKNMLCKISELVLEAGMLRHTYRLLRELQVLEPEAEEIRTMLAELETVSGERA